EQHSATYTVTLAYGCDRTVEKAGSSADAMCDCTYRVLSSRRAEIKNRLPDGLEIIVLDPQKQVAERPCREEPPDRVPGAWRSRGVRKSRRIHREGDEMRAPFALAATRARRAAGEVE